MESKGEEESSQINPRMSSIARWISKTLTPSAIGCCTGDPSLDQAFNYWAFIATLGIWIKRGPKKQANLLGFYSNSGYDIVIINKIITFIVDMQSI